MKKYIIITTLFISFLISNYTFAEENVTFTDTSIEENEEVKQLKLNGAKVVWKNKIELEFDSKIDPKSNENDSIDISVKSTWDNSEDFFVINYEINEKKVILTLENELKSNTKYEVIIYSIEWEDGSTITSGLDWALEFTTWDLSVFDKVEEKVVEEKLELKSAWTEKNETLKQNENIAWKEVKKEEIENNIEVAAANKEELAKTGPEHILLAVLALILSGLIWYVISQRKKNNM